MNFAEGIICSVFIQVWLFLFRFSSFYFRAFCVWMNLALWLEIWLDSPNTLLWISEIWVHTSIYINKPDPVTATLKWRKRLARDQNNQFCIQMMCKLMHIEIESSNSIMFCNLKTKKNTYKIKKKKHFMRVHFYFCALLMLDKNMLSRSVTLPK